MDDFKYPFVRRGKREPLSANEAMSFSRTPPGNKVMSQKIKITKAFLEKSKTAFTDDKNLHDERVSKLLHAHMERKSTSSEVLEKAAKNALRAPAKKNLERAKTVANEIGRKRGGGSLMRKMLTQDIVNALIEGSQKS